MITKPLPDGLTTLSPHIRLNGSVDDDMLDNFLAGTQNLDASQQLLVEMTTLGGDAETGRRIAQEVRLLREYHGVDVAFLGKSAVYSAGITIMAAFPPSRRFLTRDTMLLIHERRMDKTLQLKGSMRSNLAAVEDVMAEIKSAQVLETEGFEALVLGSKISLSELQKHVMARDWYVAADEALQLGLVGGLV